MASKSSGSKRSTPPRTSRRNYVPLQPEQLLPTATSGSRKGAPASVRGRGHSSSNRAKGQGATHSRVWSGQTTTTAAAALEAAQRGVDEEDILLDSHLSSLRLARKQTPKDGACLFRAVAEHVYHTQALHRVVREECVAYLQEHHKDFAAFICVNGRPYEDYVNKMRKATTWGGEVELQALSSLYRVNFEIHQLGEQVMKIDNGFPITYRLCFSHGNHYDIVYPESTMDGLRMCQSLVYELVDRAFRQATTATSSSIQSHTSTIRPGSEASSSEGRDEGREWTYRNVELECWIEETRQCELADILLAQSLALSGDDGSAPDDPAAGGEAGKRKPPPGPIVSNTHSFPALKSAAPVSAAAEHRIPEQRGPSSVELLVRAVTQEQKQYGARIKLPTDETCPPSDSPHHHHDNALQSLPSSSSSSSSGGQVPARPDTSSVATGEVTTAGASPSSSSSAPSHNNASASTGSGRKGAPRSPAPATTSWGAKRDWKQHLQQPQQQRQPSPSSSNSSNSSSSKSNSSSPAPSSASTSVASVRVGGTHGNVATVPIAAADTNNTNTNNNSATRGSAAVRAPQPPSAEEVVVVVVGEQQLGPLAASSTNGKVLLPPEPRRTPAAGTPTPLTAAAAAAAAATTTTTNRGPAVSAAPASVKYSPSIPAGLLGDDYGQSEQSHLANQHLQQQQQQQQPPLHDSTPSNNVATGRQPAVAVTTTATATNISSSSSSASRVCLSFGAFQQQVVVGKDDALSSPDLVTATAATAASGLSSINNNHHNRDSRQARPVSVVDGVGMEELEPLDIVFGDFGAPLVNGGRQPFKPGKPAPAIVLEERPGSNKGNLDDARSGGRRGRGRFGGGERPAQDGTAPSSSKASPSSLVNNTKSHAERSSKNGRGGNRGAAQQAQHAVQGYHHSQQQLHQHHQAPPTFGAHATGAAYYSSSDGGSGAHYGITYDAPYLGALPAYALSPTAHPHPLPHPHAHHGIPPPHFPQPGYLVDSYPVFYAPPAPAGLPTGPPAHPTSAGYSAYIHVPYDHVVGSPAFYGPPFDHYGTYDPYEYGPDAPFMPHEQASTEHEDAEA